MLFSSKKIIHINDKIYTSSQPILFLSKITGVASLLAVKKDGSVVGLKLSVPLIIYSVCLGIILSSCAIHGMVNEFQMGDDSYRMKGNTPRYVTCVDIILAELILILGVINVPIQFNKLHAYIKHILEIDTIIETTDIQTARTVSIRSLSIILTGTVLLLTFDLYVWHSLAWESQDGYFIITNYLPYYFSYIVAVTVECQYSHLGYCLKRRLKMINDNLERDTYLKGNDKPTHSILVKTARNKKHASDIQEEDESILSLIKAYLKICDAAEVINDLFGHIVLITIISCLLNLTVTPYFFLVELSGRCDGKYLALQTLLFLAHFFQLVLVVEPCNICLEETKNMNAIVCRLLSTDDLEETQREHLNLFFTQLLQRKIEFTAVGLGNVDRSLVTSMAAAVTVYLVTIIQFRNAGTA